jgi:hypothetical protein
VQSLDHVNVGKIAHVRIRIPTSVGSDVEGVGGEDTSAVRRHQFLPRLSFPSRDVIAKQLQGNSGLLRPYEVLARPATQWQQKVGNFSLYGSWLAAVYRITRLVCRLGV